MRRATSAVRASYIDVHGGRNHVEGHALECGYFAVDEHIDGDFQAKFDAADGAARSKWMRDVRAVIELREHAQQPNSSDGPPAYKLDQAVRGIGLRSDEHRAAGEFAVVEGKKKAAALVPIFVVVATQPKRTSPQLHDTNENS